MLVYICVYNIYICLAVGVSVYLYKICICVVYLERRYFCRHILLKITDKDLYLDFIRFILLANEMSHLWLKAD